MTFQLPQGTIELLGLVLGDLVIVAAAVAALVAALFLMVGPRRSTLRRRVAITGLVVTLAVPTAPLLESALTTATASSATGSVRFEAATSMPEATASTAAIIEPNHRSISAPIAHRIGTSTFVRAWRGSLSSAQLISLGVHAWFLGTLFAVARLVGGVVALSHLARSTEPVEGVHQRLVNELRLKLGLTRSVEVRQGRLIPVPMVLGWKQPFVALPEGLTESLDESQLRLVLAHELAHVQGRDHLVNVLVGVLRAPLFFHPAARWLASAAEAERENVCDDLAIAVGRGTPASYARTLGALAVRLGRATSPAFTGSRVVDRVERLTRHGRSTSLSRGSVRALAASVVMAAAALGMLARGQPSGNASDPELPPALAALEPLPFADPMVWLTVVGPASYSQELGFSIAAGSRVFVEERSSESGRRTALITGAESGYEIRYGGENDFSTNYAAAAWLQELIARENVLEALVKLRSLQDGAGWHYGSRNEPNGGYLSSFEFSSQVSPADFLERHATNLESTILRMNVNALNARIEVLEGRSELRLPSDTQHAQIEQRIQVGVLQALHLHSAGFYSTDQAQELLDRLAALAEEFL
ncbi:MAG: M56 family metallopeptidase [Trueperaceae bacterium]|nr:M56 family metallopeptidase [Trueperaceae bacterium]